MFWDSLHGRRLEFVQAGKQPERLGPRDRLRGDEQLEAASLGGADQPGCDEPQTDAAFVVLEVNAVQAENH